MAARTYEQWKAIQDGEAVTEGWSNSAVADWRQQQDMTITGMMQLEDMILKTQKEIETNNATKQTYSKSWFPPMVKEFQYGDALLIDSQGRQYYAVIDESKQIVVAASCTDTEDGSLKIIKVAKDDGAGGLEELTSGEKDALDVFLDAKIPSNIPYQLLSIPPDVVKYTMTVRFNPLYPKATVQAAIEAALDEFKDGELDEFKNGLTTDAIFYKSQFIAKVENVVGVESVVAQIDMELNNGTTSVVDVTEYQELVAGYFNWDGASSITFIAI